jgi:hypothetical protein
VEQGGAMKSTATLDVSTVFEQTVGSTLRTLSFLRSSDFDSVNGTNETGFKSMVISALQHFLYDYEGCKISSEYEIVVEDPDTKQNVSNFADIVVKIGSQFGLIIELKYIQGPYLDGYYKNAEVLPYLTKGDDSSQRYKKMLERR